MIENILPIAITVFSGWMLLEFIGLCFASRHFRRMRMLDERCRIEDELRRKNKSGFDFEMKG